MNRVKGKVAIITGAASGLGRAHALLLAGEGAKVVVTDIDKAGGNKVVEEIMKESGEAIFVKHNVVSENDWTEVIEKTLARYGKLDVLVNNAGILINKTIEETLLDEWRKVISVNLDGVFLGIKFAAGAMKKSGGGSIINISSIAGIVGTPNAASYCASKGGVRLLTKAAALEFSKSGLNYNIRVNSVHPGFIRTSMTDQSFEDNSLKKHVEDLHPIGRLGEAEDIAYGVLYLASDESRFITGAELVIDGGFTMV